MCISINCVDNQSRKSIPILVNINSNENVFYPFTDNVNKCGGSCNIIDDSHAWVCVPNKLKNVNLQVFKSVSRENEIRFLIQHEWCECKSRLNESACSVKQKLNPYKLLVWVQGIRWFEFL